MNKVFNEGEPVYSPKFGKGFVLGVDDTKAGRYQGLVGFEGLCDVPYFCDGSRYGRKGDKKETAGKIEWYAKKLEEVVYDATVGACNQN